MPLTKAAFGAGEISYSKVRALAAVVTDATAERFRSDEEMLVDYARTFGADDLARLLEHWRSVVDPDGATEEAAKRWDRRGAAHADSNGTGHVHATLDPESNAVFTTELEALMAAAFRRDRHDLEHLGIPPRATQQRRLDCLVEMARRSAACNTADGTHSQPEVIVMVDYDTYLRGTGTAELARGGRVTGDAARRLACHAGIVRAVTTGQSELLDLGRSTPVPNSAQRRAAALQYSTCIWPDCDIPYAWTQLHHLEPYRRGHPTGGNTDTHDLVPNCTHHHHLVHDAGFTLRRDLDTDQIEIRRPDGTLIATVRPDGPITRRRAGTLVGV